MYVRATSSSRQPSFLSCGYAIEARLVDEYLIDGSYVDELTMARRIECRG